MGVNQVKIYGLTAAIMEGLEEYVEVATSDVKACVRKAGSNVRKDIKANAPKRTGAYSKSWSVKTTKETSNTLELTVYSPKKYQLAHLLEFGHAKRNGGRSKATPHIKPAEDKAIKELESSIKKSLGG